MNQETFIDGIKEAVIGSAVKGMVKNLEAPPGRKPDQILVSLSQWYNNLKEGDKKMLQEVIKMTTHDAVFGFLCVLDGVRKAVDEVGDFKLLFVSEGKEDVLSGDEVEFLHDLL